jgi:hypothetical protein
VSISTAAVPKTYPGRRYVLLGLALAVLGVLGYAAQLSMRQLSTPWYLPVSATIGVIAIVFALWQKRSVWRILALLLVGLLATAEWGILLGSRRSPYNGPVETGKPFPAFATMQANGDSFTHNNLKGEHSVLVCFRGRW